MKRFHVHVGVTDLDASIRFYSALFGAQPTVCKTDYAKWMVEDPRINFAISKRRDGLRVGVNHLGLQVDSDAELEALREQAQQADLAAVAEQGANCCYARSNKVWYTDPTGVAWETYHSLGQIDFFGDEHAGAAADAQDARCVPAAVPAEKQEALTVLAAAPVGQREATGTSCCAPARSNARPAKGACCA